MMVKPAEPALRTLQMTGLEAVLTGLLAGGCRLAFAPAAAYAIAAEAMGPFARRLERLGGALVQAQGDHAVVTMAAGAALSGARVAALVSDSMLADCALAGLDDLSPVLVDVSGRLPLHTAHVRVVVAPHTARAAFEAGVGLFDQAGALRGPALIAGLEVGREAVEPQPVTGGPVPIHHYGPDDPDMLLVGAGPGFAACSEARDRLEAEGVSAAHLHLLQVSPFPGAIVAPALTSARRVLVVEPGGPGTLAGLIRSHLGAPAAPFGELPRLAGAPLGPDEIHWRAREVMAL